MAFKILLALFLNFFLVKNPECSAMQSSQIEERRGTAPSAGTTFATKADADEALARGQVDWSKNPFVPNVCQLIHSKTEETITSATITQIAPNIYLCCKHTAEVLTAANTYFEPKRYRGFEVHLRSGTDILCQLKNLEILPHKDVDLALIKLEFASGTVPTSSFLPLATSISEGEQGNGFVVSCGEMAVASGSFEGIGRTLSIHKFQKKENTLKSSLNGQLPEEKQAAMMEAAATLALSQSTSNPRSMGEALMSIKQISRTAIFEFPIPSEEDKSVRLMSILADGASGSPLIVKQGGTFKLLGMLSKGGFMPEALAGAREIAVINKANLVSIKYDAVFLDLTTQSEWIERSIAILSSRR
ncbi:MAG: hypothetical protein WCJ92_07555 [Alphaproteobacteria bacterium]